MTRPLPRVTQVRRAIVLLELEEGYDRTFPGSYLLLPTRSNFDRAYHPVDPVVLSVGRLGATYCVLKEIAAAPPGG